MTSSTTRTSIGQLPNFLVIGAMKAGTTSLYHYLRAHPQVFMSSVKELDFEGSTYNGDNGQPFKKAGVGNAIIRSPTIVGNMSRFGSWHPGVCPPRG